MIVCGCEPDFALDLKVFVYDYLHTSEDIKDVSTYYSTACKSCRLKLKSVLVNPSDSDAQKASVVGWPCISCCCYVFLLEESIGEVFVHMYRHIFYHLH